MKICVHYLNSNIRSPKQIVFTLGIVQIFEKTFLPDFKPKLLIKTVVPIRCWKLCFDSSANFFDFYRNQVQRLTSNLHQCSSCIFIS